MKERMPPLESLRVFEASARNGNFSRAASELGMSPAAVSLRVRQLEADLGKELFHRNGPKIVLNAAGKELAVQMGEALRIARNAVRACRVHAEPVRVTCTPTFASRWLMPRLPKYLNSSGCYPVSLDMTCEVRAHDKFDIAIRSGAGGWRGVDATKLLPIVVAPMVSPELADRISLRAPADLIKAPLVPDPCWSAWFELAGVHSPQLNCLPPEYDTSDMASTSALGGVGAALLSIHIFDPLISSGRLLAPFAQAMDTGLSYFIAWPHGAKLQRSVRSFAIWLECEARKTAEGLTAGRYRPVLTEN